MTATAAKGDRIAVDSNRAGVSAREGTILEIIEHSYGIAYRVRWDDGHESTLRPTAGTVHTYHPKRTSERTARAATTRQAR